MQGVMQGVVQGVMHGVIQGVILFPTNDKAAKSGLDAKKDTEILPWTKTPLLSGQDNSPMSPSIDKFLLKASRRAQ